jgi:putative membrane protein
MMSNIIVIIPAAAAGAVFASLPACIPGLHIYNIMGLLALLTYHISAIGYSLPVEITLPFATGLVAGYSVLNTIPSILLAAPDESAMFTVLPGQKMFLNGHGLDGVMITTVGSAAGLFLLLTLLGPAAPTILPTVKTVLRPHTHWILWCVIAFMLMSEWPKTAPCGQAGWKRFFDAWKSLSMGLITFLLSGILGFILFFAPTVDTTVSFQNLLPAFVGLFTMPWLLLNIASNLTPPQQAVNTSVSIGTSTAVRGTFAGAMGGGFAAFFPIVTGGVGGLLAGHATAIRDDKTFLISQGTSKLIYYVGGLLLFFVPQLEMRRGGGAWIISGIVTPYGYYEYFMALTAIAISGAVALVLVRPLASLTLTAINRIGYRTISCGALIITICIVGGITGTAGTAIMAVATGIGLLPLLFGARRMNCLGVILLPMACSMSGVGAAIAQWMGLI